MKPVVGVVAEYNPFHNGHRYQLEAIRRHCPGALILCVMSGNVTQRGEFAFLRKSARADMAVRNGADLVWELPAVWACGSAEAFAQAAVYLLKATGVVTHLCFGSETDDIALLRDTVSWLSHPLFPRTLREKLAQGVSFPVARQRTLETLSGRSFVHLAQPNNILGVEYLKALALLDPQASITPFAMPRRAAAHHADAPAGRYASASWLRAQGRAGQDLSAWLPEPSRQIYEREIASGRAPLSMQPLETALLAHLRRTTADHWKALSDVTEGLENRLADAAVRACSADDFYALVKNKRVPLSRLRRIVLGSFLGITDYLRRQWPPYLRLLAASEAGEGMLADVKQNATLPLLVKSAAVKTLAPEAQEIFAVDCLATDMLGLLYPDPQQRTGGNEWRLSPVFVRSSEV